MRAIFFFIILILTVNISGASEYVCVAHKIKKDLGGMIVFLSFPRTISTLTKSNSAYFDFGPHKVSSDLKLDFVNLFSEIECKAENDCSFYGKLFKWVTLKEGDKEIELKIIGEVLKKSITGTSVVDFEINDNYFIRVSCE